MCRVSRPVWRGSGDFAGEWVSGGEGVLCGYVSGDGECGKYCTVEEKCKIVKQ